MHTNQDLSVFRQVLLFAAGSWEKTGEGSVKTTKVFFFTLLL
jgi:hypothetical protein